jgi:hypothetical protein
MKKSSVAMLAICTLLIALFVYAATAKLADFYNFQSGRSESPLIAPFAGFLTWVVTAGIFLQKKKHRTPAAPPAID